jgi:hypothetical protein
MLSIWETFAGLIFERVDRVDQELRVVYLKETIIQDDTEEVAIDGKSEECSTVASKRESASKTNKVVIVRFYSGSVIGSSA